MARKQDKSVSKILLIFVSILALIIGILAGAIASYIQDKPVSDKIISGDLEIHFLELGNDNSGDSILIQVGENDILVDAGSKTNSLQTIRDYLSQHIEDDTLEYVIVTHAHEDHYANFAGNGETSLLSYYKTGTLIQFPKTNQDMDGMYENYVTMVDKEEDEGTKVYTALECYNNENGCSRKIDLGFGVELEILNNYYYTNEADTENDYSVCFMINQGDNHFLFTGDLEAEGEEKLIELNDLPEVTLYKAGHHGSKTSSTDTLLSVIKPEIVVVTCVAGSVEYTDNLDNTFPTSIALDNIAKYTDKVYVTTQGSITPEADGTGYDDNGFSSLNGSIVVTSNKDGVVVTGSNNSTILKDSTWYKHYYETYRDSDFPWAN